MKQTRKAKFIQSLPMILVITNILLVFLTPYAISIFRGSISGSRTTIDFTVDIFGNWVEQRIFYGFSEGTSIGVASNIGSYIPGTVVLISIALFLSFIGTPLIASPLDFKKKNVSFEEKVRKGKITRLAGSIFSILSGLLGIISLILFGVFKLTIVQPYDHFPSSNTPVVRLSFSFYFSLLCFTALIIAGIFINHNCILL